MGVIREDIRAVLERDPAARNGFEVFCTYPGFHALFNYRIAHFFYRHKCRFLARMISNWARFISGIDIHPGATIGTGVFIDHGSGVVIGETCEIGNGVTIYQGVTLGGTGKDVGKRHPTIEEGAMISAGAKVLGPITVGRGSKIGAGSVVLKDIPANCTVVGIPGRVVKVNDNRVAELDQTSLPDPVLEEFARLSKRIERLEDELGVRSCRYSMTTTEIIEEENAQQ